MPSLRSFAFCFWALGLAATGAGQDRAPGDATAWRSQRERIQRLMAAGDWRAAQRNLQAMLQNHVGAGYALAERESVLGDLGTIVFHLEHPEPPLDSLVDGSVRSWNPRTRELAMGYPPGRTRDLQPQPTGDPDVQVWLHPAVFPGGVTVRLGIPQGRSADVQLLLGVTPAGAIYAAPGDAQRACCIVLAGKSGSPRVLASVASPWVGGAAGEMTALVQRGQIVIQNRGRTVLTARHGVSDHRVGVLARKGAQPEFGLDGVTTGAWVGRLLAADEQRRRRGFAASYRPEDHAPAWLLTGEVAQSAEIGALPTAGGQRSDGAVAPRTESIPAAALTPLRAGREALAVGDLKGAWKQGRAAEAAAPGHPAPLVLLARVRLAEVRAAEAAALLDRALADHPGHAAAAGERALLALDDGDPDRALGVLRSARLAGCRDPELLRVQGIIDRAQRGPVWRRTAVHAVDGVVVRSDAGRELCVEVARMVQEAQRQCAGIYGPAAKRLRSLRVYVFQSRAAMTDYIGDLGAPLHGFAAGVYLPRLQQLVVWRDGHGRNFRHTVHHEAVHGEIHRRFGLVPVWWNEGQAERLAGQLGEGLAAAHASTLTQVGLMPLARWVRLDRAGFYGRRGGYAQAWLLADLLADGWRGLPQELRRALGRPGGVDPQAILGLPGGAMDQLDQALAARLEFHRKQRVEPAPR